MANITEKLNDNLKYLNIPNLIDDIDHVLAKSNNMSFLEILLELTNLSVSRKKEICIENKLKSSNLPIGKTFENYDFDFQPNLNRNVIMEFKSLRFLEQRENILFIGSSGVGKTHLATAIGYEAVQQQCKTLFIKCIDLLTSLKKAKYENKLDTRIRHFFNFKLLIIDEFGFLKITEEESRLLFTLLDKRYETKSTIITTNYDLDELQECFENKVMAKAIIGRLVHHSKLIKIYGECYRSKEFGKENLL